MYALGLPVLRRRKSTFIHGAEDDAREVIDHLAGYISARLRGDGLARERDSPPGPFPVQRSSSAVTRPLRLAEMRQFHETLRFSGPHVVTRN